MAGANRNQGASSNRTPGIASGQLARTGTDSHRLTGLGIGLVLLGFVLLVTSTRYHRQRAQA